MDRQALGRRGEDLAAAYLRGLGWQVLERNWRCRLGELDLVARDRDALVFCEVKCRSGLGYGSPLESITAAKLARLRHLAAEWLTGHPGHPGPVRLDAIGVLLPPGAPASVTHLRGIGA